MSCTSPLSNPRNKPSVKKRRSHEAPSFFAKASPYWGFHPPFSFGLAQKKTGRGRSKRKTVIPGSCESVQQRLTVFCRVRRTRYHSRWFFPTCRTLAVNGVQPPDGRYCSFRCRWPGVPGQRAAKRNARKEKLVTFDQHPQIRHAESHAGAWNCKRRCPAHLAEAFRASRAASEKTPVFAPWPVPWGISGFLFHRARRILFFKREWGAQFPRHQPVMGAKKRR